jgi:hypothetical protein
MRAPASPTAVIAVSHSPATQAATHHQPARGRRRSSAAPSSTSTSSGTGGSSNAVSAGLMPPALS